MKIRAFAAAALAAATMTIATPAAIAAPAQTAGFDSLVGGVIDNADCGALQVTLQAIDGMSEGVLLDANTTRSQLATRLSGLNGKVNTNNSPILTIMAMKYSHQTADRALACKLVKEDAPLDKGFAMSSQLTQFLPVVTQMSSQFKQ